MGAVKFQHCQWRDFNTSELKSEVSEKPHPRVRPNLYNLYNKLSTMYSDFKWKSADTKKQENVIHIGRNQMWDGPDIGNGRQRL